MRGLLTTVLLLFAVGVPQAGFAADAPLQPAITRIEAIPIETLSLSAEQFLKGDASGKPTIISGVLRVASGTGRLPVVVFVHGSSGVNPNVDVWGSQFEAMGISTFVMDSFAGRGIVSTLENQSQLGLLNMSVDIYRALSVLAAHPRVDPRRIAVMGFSLGGMAVLYSSVKRFQKMWNTSGIEPAAFIALYPACNWTFIDDTELSNRPIRIFHGISDDYVPIGPCRSYLERHRQSATDFRIIEFANTWHGFDYPTLPSEPVAVPNGLALNCALREEPLGTIINSETGKPLTARDRCIGRNPHMAYSGTATHATEEAVKALLKMALKLN